MAVLRRVAAIERAVALHAGRREQHRSRWTISTPVGGREHDAEDDRDEDSIFPKP